MNKNPDCPLCGYPAEDDPDHCLLIQCTNDECPVEVIGRFTLPFEQKEKNEYRN